MKELKKILQRFLQKLDDYLKKYQKTIKVVCGKWYVDKINAKLPHIKRSLLIKK